MHLNIVGGNFRNGICYILPNCEFFAGHCARIYLPDGSSRFYKLDQTTVSVETVIEDKNKPTIKVKMSDELFFIAKTTKKVSGLLKIYAAAHDGRQTNGIVKLPALTLRQEWKRLKPGTKVVRVFSYFSLVFIVFTIVMNLFFKPLTEEQRNLSFEEAKSGMAVVNCQTHIKKMLKSPQSADFPLFPDMEINGNIYKINSYVDSRNAFNANIRTYYTCQLELVGEDPHKRLSWKVKNIHFKK